MKICRTSERSVTILRCVSKEVARMSIGGHVVVDHWVVAYTDRYHGQIFLAHLAELFI